MAIIEQQTWAYLNSLPVDPRRTADVLNLLEATDQPNVLPHIPNIAYDVVARWLCQEPTEGRQEILAAIRKERPLSYQKLYPLIQAKQTP